MTKLKVVTGLCSIRNYLFGLVLAVPFLSYAAPPGASLTGDLSVTSSGAASYQLPLLTPPGTIKPALSLQYSSQGGNGPVGMGWSLGGLSQISRCPRVKIIDGVDDGTIQFGDNSRLCLDGQRLILVSGTYGSNNAEYRTQIDSGLKIVGKGSFASAMGWFEVRTQDGQVMEYGNTANSRLVLTTTAAPTVWALNKVSDRFTNYYTISYLLDSGMLYPQTISYAGNTTMGTTPARTVTLTWAPATERPDAIPVYVGRGVSSTIKRRLSDITNNANPARYRFHYSTSDAKLSNLTKVEYCPDGSTTNCLKVESEYGQAKHPTTGKRTSDPQTILAAFGVNQGWGDQDRHPRELADVNGDGILDIVGFFNDGVYVAFGTATGFSTPVKKLSNFDVANGWSSNSTHPRMVVDINGDGLADIVGFGHGGVYVALSTGNNFAPMTLWLSNFGPSLGWTDQDAHPRMLADIDGDGLLDIVGFHNNVFLTARNKRTHFENAVTSTITTQFTRNSGWSSNSKFPRMMADVNGDGRDDIVGFGPNGVMVALASTTVFQTPTRWIDNYKPATHSHTQQVVWVPGSEYLINLIVTNRQWHTQAMHPRYLVDINGDGLPDIVGIDHKVQVGHDELGLGLSWESLSDFPSIYFSKNTGNGFAPAELLQIGSAGEFQSTNHAGISSLDSRVERLAANYTLADVNQDGRGDIVIYKGLCTSFRPSFGTTLGPEECLANGFTQDNGNWTDKDERIIGDIHGKGVVDILGFSPAGVIISRGEAKNPNQILVFKDDLGESSISYSTLASSTSISLYTKDTGSTFPLVDLRVPMTVVAALRSSDGIGGSRATGYRYGGLRSHVDYGSLGFRWIEESSTIEKYDWWGQGSRTVERSEFHQNFPLTGLLHRTQSQLCAPGERDWNDPTPIVCHVTSQEVSDWSVSETGTTSDRKIYRPYITKTTEHSWNLVGEDPRP